ncbi:hypothetical protein [Hymenobacter algoricola]|uniref:Glycosyltransferase RgtA/B/C/D-like domain-containing protein n=1 Tax=Hymenobacter algoricola TaxID=486267 RepID=A0ABP7NQG9_9BACT
MVLTLCTGLLLGCYFETNDDLVLIFLLRGTGMLAPASNMHLYFHGLAPLLAKLYSLQPTVPWYGLLLYSLLTASAILVFKALDPYLARLSNSRRIGVLCFFFFLTYAEHVMRMNFTRPPILLAGATVLYTLHLLRLDRLRLGWVLLGTGLLLLGWAVRSNGAFVGLLVTAPAVFLVGRAQRRRAVLVLGWYAAVLVGASLSLGAAVDSSQSAYEHLHDIRARINDYQMYTFHPTQPHDAVAFESVQPWWGIGDTTLVNRAFYARATRIDLNFWARKVVPPKAASLLGRLASDYFLYLVLNALLIWALFRACPGPERRLAWWWLLYSAFIGGLLLALGIGMQLPPRVASPALTLYTLVNFCYIFPRLTPSAVYSLPRSFQLAGLGLALLLTLTYAGKTAARSYRHGQEKRENEQYLAQLRAQVGRQPLVVASLYNSFRSLSPLKNYDLGGGLVYMLNGWTANDPSQRAVLRALVGDVTYHQAMNALARRADVVWAFPRGFSSFFTRYLSAFSQQAPAFCPIAPTFPDAAQADFPQLHRVCPAAAVAP